MFQPLFGARLGTAIKPAPRRSNLGFTPTGAQAPATCTDLGVRMIEDQGGYTPIGCPIGPDCYDIIDAVTGQIVIAKAKGNVPWVSLCSQYGYTDPGASTKPTEPVQSDQCLPNQRFDNAAGKCMAPPAEVETPSGRRPGACRQPDGSWNLYDVDTKAFISNVPNTVVNGQDFPNAPSSISSPGFCETAGSVTEPPPQEAPPSVPEDEGMIPISIDIQAFTPGGTGPIPTQPIMQPAPVAPKPPAPKPPPAPAVKVLPKAPEEPKPDLASVGLAVAIVAAAALGLSLVK